MAEVVAQHVMFDADSCACDEMFYDYRLPAEQIKVEHSLHVEERLAANGYGKLGSTQFVLQEREAELLKLKGPCRAPQCRLHHAHRGPCDTRRPQ